MCITVAPRWSWLRRRQRSQKLNLKIICSYVPIYVCNYFIYFCFYICMQNIYNAIFHKNRIKSWCFMKGSWNCCRCCSIKLFWASQLGDGSEMRQRFACGDRSFGVKWKYDLKYIYLHMYVYKTRVILLVDLRVNHSIAIAFFK